MDMLPLGPTLLLGTQVHRLVRLSDFLAYLPSLSLNTAVSQSMNVGTNLHSILGR